MSAYDKTSIQINRCKRILALVDTYVDCPTQDYRTALRKALMEEFEAPAIAPPVAAGSVNTAEFRARMDALGQWNDVASRDALMTHVHAWGAQQREAGRLEGEELASNSMKEFHRAKSDVGREFRERAEKAEAELKQVNEWRNAALQENMRLSDIWMDRVTRSEARVKELEAEDLAIHRKLVAEKLRADQGWARYEAANRAKNDLEREKAAAYQRGNVAAAAILDHVKPAGIVGSGPNAKEGDRPCWTPDCGTF